MDNWAILIAGWSDRYACRDLKPLPSALLEAAMSRFGEFPEELVALYKYVNGISLDWFVLLPFEDPHDLKRTWDSIERANNPEKTRFLDGDPNLLRQFIVFAALDAGRCAAFDRTDNTIWYEEDEELHQTDLSFAEFIELCLREVSEL